MLAMYALSRLVLSTIKSWILLIVTNVHCKCLITLHYICHLWNKEHYQYIIYLFICSFFEEYNQNLRLKKFSNPCLCNLFSTHSWVGPFSPTMKFCWRMPILTLRNSSFCFENVTHSPQVFLLLTLHGLMPQGLARLAEDRKVPGSKPTRG